VRCVAVARFERGEGDRVEARGSHMWSKATASTTEGRFRLMERRLPPGGRMPPAHHRVGNDEAHYVLDGIVEFHADGVVSEGGPDTCVLVPAGASHTFGSTSDAPVRLLVLHAPDLDAYFVELGSLWSGAAPPRARRSST
jgi:mannose-6-phosphate isomerase-like protein (cupin superfamily)